MTPTREFAGWWRRVGAALIDALPITLVASAVLWAFGFDFAAYWDDEGGLLLTTGGRDYVYLVACAAFAAVYFIPTMLAWDGQSIGKRVLSIRVVRADGQPLTVRDIAVRQVVLQGLVLGVSCVAMAINYLLPLRDRERRAGHDRIARTRVVRAA